MNRGADRARTPQGELKMPEQLFAFTVFTMAMVVFASFVAMIALAAIPHGYAKIVGKAISTLAHLADKLRGSDTPRKRNKK